MTQVIPPEQAPSKPATIPVQPIPPAPRAAPRIGKSVREVIDSPAFKTLVRKRWTLNVVLLAALFVTYYGFILLIAWNKPLINTKIGEYTTLGIPLGIAVIVLGWVFTAVYVAVSNAKYDPEVDRIKKELEG